MKKTNGITLVALIITVIVMLILVSVTVSVVINSNLIGVAQNAADATKQAYENESKFGSGPVTIGGKTYESLSDYMEMQEKGSISKVIEKEEATNTQLNNANVKQVVRTESPTEIYEAPIPVGFTASKATGEKSIVDGLVIYEGDTEVNDSNVSTAKTTRNQFVWIPVEVNKTVVPVDTATSIASFRRSVWENNERVENNVQSETSFPNSSRAWSSFTEPYSYDSNDYDGENGTGIAVQIAELTESIYNYGGFYIGRYEAGSTTERTKESSQTASFIIQQDKYPYIYVIWGSSMNDISAGGAVYLSNNLYPSTNTNYGATSMLCTGVCWDAVLDFVKDSRHNVTSSNNWGNYRNVSFNITRGEYAIYDNTNVTLGNFQPIEGSKYKKQSETESSTEGIVLLTTGATERNSSKNIYDIAGNCYEWTTEANSTRYRVLRGGGYGYNSSTHPSCNTYENIPNVVSINRSFRPIMYVK